MPARKFSGRQLAPQRRDEGGEVGQLEPPLSEQSARRGGQAGERGEPGDHVGFDLHQGGRGSEDPGVAVHRAGDEVGDRGEGQAAARDVGQVAGSGGIERAGDGALEEKIEDLVQHERRPLRQRLGE